MWDLGDDPATSAALKLTGNFWIVSQIELSAQCLALATKSGIEGGRAKEGWVVFVCGACE